MLTGRIITVVAVEAGVDRTTIMTCGAITPTVLDDLCTKTMVVRGQMWQRMSATCRGVPRRRPADPARWERIGRTGRAPVARRSAALGAGSFASGVTAQQQRGTGCDGDQGVERDHGQSGAGRQAAVAHDVEHRGSGGAG